MFYKLKYFLRKLTKKPTSKELETPSYGWFGSYDSWEEVQKECEGYDSNTILDKVKSSVLKVRNGEAAYERDSFLFDEIQYSQPLIKAFTSSIENERLHVVDFGGSLGSSYFQHKELFKELKELKWSVIEQNHFVDCGKKEIEIDALKFYFTIDEALQNQNSHVLFISSVIQYFEKPFELIDKLISYNFKYIIIDRTAFIAGEKDRLTKQIVPEFIYKATYPAWFFNEKKFLDAFLTKYELISDYQSAFDSDATLQDGKNIYFKGFYLKLK